MPEERKTIDELARAVIDTYEQATKIYMDKMQAAQDEYAQVLGTKVQMENDAVKMASDATSTAAAGQSVAEQAKAEQASEVDVAGSGIFLTGDQFQQFTNLLGKLAKSIESISERIVT